MPHQETKNEALIGGSGLNAGLGAWISIDSAPKDARILLGFSRPVYAGISAIFGKWYADEHAKKPNPYWSHDLDNLTGKAGARANQPTHWMPLPEAPNVI